MSSSGVAGMASRFLDGFYGRGVFGPIRLCGCERVYSILRVC